MAQAQLEVGRQNSMTLCLEDGVTLKLWKRADVMMVTLLQQKRRNLVMPFDTLKVIMKAEKLMHVASDFVRGLVGAEWSEYWNNEEAESDEKAEVEANDVLIPPDDHIGGY